MQLLFQLWGGGFYLLNKVFLSRSERCQGQARARWRKWSWIVYLLGLPAWVVVFVGAKNWIAAAVETSGAAAMVLGLFAAVRGVGTAPKWLDSLALGGAALGIAYSIYDLGGLRLASQWLELGVVVGFLCGTYLVAKLRPEGYLFFLVMNLSNAALMFIQGYHWLVLQQLLSVAFILDAYLVQARRPPDPARST